MDLDSNSDSDTTEEMEMDVQGKRVQIEEARRRSGMFLSLVGIGTSLCAMYHLKYLNKQKTRISKLSGFEWVKEIMNTPGESYRMFRMESHVFEGLCARLVENYGLKSTNEMSVEEALAMFLWTCAHNQSNRNVQNRFKHSGETVSRKFGEVLDAIIRFSVDIIRPSDYEFKEVPKKIQNDKQFMPHFKGCIGAIDGTHVEVVVPAEDQLTYIGRKRYTTQNVMVVCDFDLLFTFVVAGWPGSAHDARILSRALQDYRDVFPHPPNGKYYLVDAGYANVKGYLGPYKGEDLRYHIPDFVDRPPEGYQETFNYVHARIRNHVERSIGVWKNRFRILSKMRNFALERQTKIIVATMALHNYIRKNAIKDKLFDRCDNDPDYMPLVDGEITTNNGVHVGRVSYENGAYLEDDGSMAVLRNSIVFSLMGG